MRRLGPEDSVQWLEKKKQENILGGSTNRLDARRATPTSTRCFDMTRRLPMTWAAILYRRNEVAP